MWGIGSAAHLAGDSAVVGAALPEAPAVACDVSDQLVLIGEVHFPDQGSVTKNPHLSLPRWSRRCRPDLRLIRHKLPVAPAQAR